MQVLQPYMIYIIIGLSLAAWAYFYFRSDVPKRFLTPLYLFTKRKQVYRIDCENRGGLMFPADLPGGFVELQPAAIVRRWGRVWKLRRDPSAIEASRHRETIYVVRENDPTPLTIGLGVDGRYQGDQIDNPTFKELSNLNQRAAAAQAQIEGTTRDIVANRLTLGLIIAVSGAVLAWGGFFAMTIIYGAPPA